MFEINYKLSEEQIIDEREIPRLDSGDFRYFLFLGSFELVTSYEKLSVDWDWVPLLDLSLSLLDISHNLLHGQYRDHYEFAETNEYIHFTRIDDTVIIQPSFDEVTLFANHTEFRSAVRRFNKILVPQLVDQNPALYQNRLFLTYTNVVSLI